MYYLDTIEDKVRVPPQLFSSKLDDAIVRILRDKYERRIYKDTGIILTIEKARVLSKGIIIPGDSGAHYKVQFDAVAFKPAVNEVYGGDIKEVVEFGAFLAIGPLQGLLHVSQISKDKYTYDKKNKTLSSRVGKKALKRGDACFIKVSTVSLKATTNDTKIGLTMRPEGLGKQEWLDGPAIPEEKEKPRKKDEK